MAQDRQSHGGWEGTREGGNWSILSGAELSWGSFPSSVLRALALLPSDKRGGQ